MQPTELLQCPQCSGELTLLGQLGNRLHFRCRHCGAGCSDMADNWRGLAEDSEGTQ